MDHPGRGAIRLVAFCRFSAQARTLALPDSNSAWVIAPESRRDASSAMLIPGTAGAGRLPSRIAASRHLAPRPVPGACCLILSPRANKYTKTPRNGKKITKISHMHLGEAAQVMATEDVGEHVEQRHDPDEPQEKYEHRPEHAENGVVVSKHLLSIPITAQFVPHPRRVARSSANATVRASVEVRCLAEMRAPRQTR